VGDCRAQRCPCLAEEIHSRKLASRVKNSAPLRLGSADAAAAVDANNLTRDVSGVIV
jgi:hypothetical protein